LDLIWISEGSWSVFKRKPAPHLDSGVGTGSREENASEHQTRASVPI
jgi:hypothetical protein